MHGGGMGGGMRGGGWGGGGWGGAHFGGSRFTGASFAHAGISPRFSSFAHRGHFADRRFHRFAFVGGPFGYDDCWRRVWTPYGLQWTNPCGDYDY
jgi:hypothetical protein